MSFWIPNSTPLFFLETYLYFANVVKGANEHLFLCCHRGQLLTCCLRLLMLWQPSFQQDHIRPHIRGDTLALYYGPT